MRHWVPWRSGGNGKESLLCPWVPCNGGIGFGRLVLCLWLTGPILGAAGMLGHGSHIEG